MMTSTRDHGRPAVLTVLTQKPPFILGNLRVPTLAAPVPARARAQFCRFNNG